MEPIKKTGKPIYPYAEWEISEDNFAPENNLRSETIFAQGNGYLGLRGNFEEGYAGSPNTSVEGTYINAFYESEIIRYPETAYGYAEHSQTMLNVTNGKGIRLFFDGEEFKMRPENTLEYRRVLLLKEGVLRRSLIWKTSKGQRLKIEIERLVSFENKHVAATRFVVTPLDAGGEVRFISAIDGDVQNLTASNDPRVGSGLHGRVLDVQERAAAGDGGWVVQKTRHSKLALACAMTHRLQASASVHQTSQMGDLSVSVSYATAAAPGQAITLDKFVVYVTSRDVAEDKLVDKAQEILRAAQQTGFDGFKASQAAFLQKFWDAADVEIKGDLALQQGLRVNSFHLLQSVGRDGYSNIGAKGLTGEGYEGHYFWDTETYILPFFLYTEPEISRSLLEYRYHILDKARERARQMSHPKGALFPWRTINGEECSAYYPAGTAQYHIDADIAFAIRRYMDATQDAEFMRESGAEMLFETARLWADLGAFIPSKGNKFCFNSVTGPDEYNAVVNNNCYTNLMAKTNLEYAHQMAAWLSVNAPADYQRVAQKIGLEPQEIEFWRRAANQVYVPYDAERGIHPQDDEFLNKAPWDFAHVPADQYPLLLHFHPLVIYRHQVCKQADLVLALLLLGNFFTPEEKKRNFDFYEPLTTHDSSLSTAVFSVIASELGYQEKAYRYFLSTARMDLDDTHKNTKDGIHAANMAGTWMCVVNGFGGMRVYDGQLSFAPSLPAQWEYYRFRVLYRGRRIEVTVKPTGAEYRLLSGAAITIFDHDQPKELRPN